MTRPAAPPLLAMPPTLAPAAAPQPAMRAATPLDPADLDTVYTTLCQTLTTLGEAQAPLMLARLALLALVETGDAATALRLIAAAADGLAPPG